MLFVPLENSASHVDLSAASTPLEGGRYSKPRFINVQLFGILFINGSVAKGRCSPRNAITIKCLYVQYWILDIRSWNDRRAGGVDLFFNRKREPGRPREVI